MVDQDIQQALQLMGKQAREAARLLCRASTAAKNTALLKSA